MSKNLTTFTTTQGTTAALFVNHEVQKPLEDKNCYITGPVIDRLHAFEEFGYEPEELEKILVLRKARSVIEKEFGIPKAVLELAKYARGEYSAYVDATTTKIPMRSGRYPWGSTPTVQKLMPEIKDVKFNDPATIVFWSDDTKTVVKAQPGEPYDPEKGLAMAISKKALGNKGNYYDAFKKYLDEVVEED